MAGLLTDLSGYLRAGAGAPFVWGQRDCALWVCGWIEKKRGVDPSRDLRGKYSDARSCGRILASGGGLCALAVTWFSRCGLQETVSPSVGDVGCIEFAGREMLAIKTPRGWAVKTIAGISTSGAVNVLKAWSVA